MEKSKGCAIAILALIICGIIGLTIIVKYVVGNKQFIDLKQNFNTAYVVFPDGNTQKMKIKKWNDYENSDSIQIIDIDGKPFYTHLNRVVLTKE